MMCPECYSDKSRVTPLLGAEYCLKNHLQYICSRCGRVICAETSKSKNKARCLMPFSTLEKAKYYLKVAEVIKQEPCKIYKIFDNKTKRTSFRIFSDNKTIVDFLNRNKSKVININKPEYSSKNIISFNEKQIRKLTNKEIIKYLSERKKKESIRKN